MDEDVVKELERLTDELEVWEVERDLRKFIPLAWPIIEPNRPFIPNWHIDVVADHLMACTEGHIQNLIINIPPRHMKSQTVSIFWPAWEWCRFPHIKGLFVSYGRNLVIRDAVKTRRVIQSAWYQKLWGHMFKLASDQNVKSHFENDQGGARLVGSMDAGVTGEGGDRLCVDDPLKLEDADNQAQLEHVAEFWDSVLSSRVNDPVTGVRVIIMQRLNAKDLTGHILSKETGWTHLYLPTEFEPTRRCKTFYHRNDYRILHDPVQDKVSEQVTVVPIEFKDPRTREGELLNPLRFGPEQIQVIKTRNGPWHYAGQQQQRPTPAGGGLFMPSWWQYYVVLPDQVEMQGDACQTWDMAFKKLDMSSYVCGYALARVGPNIYVLNERRDRMSFTQSLDAVKAMSAAFPWIGPKLVEDKANGPAVVNVLQSEIMGLIPMPNNGGTFALAQATSYMVRAGNVWLPGKRDPDGNIVPAYDWVKEMVKEFEDYPRGEFSDRVSALTQGLFWFHEKQGFSQDSSDIIAIGEKPRAEQPEKWIF
jgi:phage terminase large subunit-like protein